MKWLLVSIGIFGGAGLAFLFFIFLPARALPTLQPRCLFCTPPPQKTSYRLHAADPGPVLPIRTERSYVSLQERKSTSDRYPSIFAEPAGAIPWLRPTQIIRDSSISGLKANYVREYRIDEFGRRANSGATGRPQHVLLLGCSYVFGSGVEGGETLPARIAEKISSHQTYNLGNPGDSPASILLRTEDRRYFSGIQQREGVALYYLINDHTQRSLGSYHLSRSWGWSLPRFELREGKPIHAGPMNKLGLPSILFEAWQYMEYLGITWPLYYSNRDLELVASLLDGIRENYLRKFPKGKFVVVIAPRLHAQPITYDLRAHLEKYRLEYLDYGDREIHDFVAEPFIPGDGHPNSSYYEKVSSWIARDLPQIASGN